MLASPLVGYIAIAVFLATLTATGIYAIAAKLARDRKRKHNRH